MYDVGGLVGCADVVLEADVDEGQPIIKLPELQVVRNGRKAGEELQWGRRAGDLRRFRGVGAVGSACRRMGFRLLTESSG